MSARIRRRVTAERRSLAADTMTSRFFNTAGSSAKALAPSRITSPIIYN
jgi:hypothetical protein